MKKPRVQQYSINKTNFIFFLTIISSLSLLLFLLDNQQPARGYTNNILKIAKVNLAQDHTITNIF